jgi:hypothetical protein
MSDIRASLDHVVRKLLELRRYINAECRRGPEVDHQIKLFRALYRQVTGLSTVQDFRDVITGPSVKLTHVRPISQQTASLRKFGQHGNEREPLWYRKLPDLLHMDVHQRGR